MISAAGARPLIVANWKLHGDAGFTAELLNALKRRLADAADVDVVVCPPLAYLPQARDLLRGGNIALGAQDVSDRERGAYTGENSARMLKDVGCEYVIVGHSERRRWYHEDDELIARKFAAALAAGLTPILCVGETLEQRDAGEAGRVVAAQLAATAGTVAAARWVVAYEPVWAIGTGRTASVGQIAEMHAAIRACPPRPADFRPEARSKEAEQAEGAPGGRTPAGGGKDRRQRGRAPEDDAPTSHFRLGSGPSRVVYGGSVKPDNARALFQADGVDGGLIGGASLDAESFCRICAAARNDRPGGVPGDA